MSEATKLTKTQLISTLCEKTGLEKKQVAGFLDTLVDLAVAQLGKDGPGEFTLPKLVKLKTKATPAQPERQGVHPITKQPHTFPAKPASRKVKASPVKEIKDAIAK